MKHLERNAITGIYEALDDDRTSTERLLEMTRQAATEALGREVDMDDVVEAVFGSEPDKPTLAERNR